jgi:hypothetical protein
VAAGVCFQLDKERSPFVKDLMAFLRELMKDYKNEIKGQYLDLGRGCWGLGGGLAGLGLASTDKVFSERVFTTETTDCCIMSDCYT